MSFLKKVNSFYLSFAIMMMLISSCASSGSLSGGLKDTEPPKLIPEQSTENNKTQFIPKELVFEFDEYIEVRNAVKEVLISPPIVYIPKITARGKKLVVAFNKKEELKSNTTYAIQFGNCIVDLHEGNELKDFRYVFSTGDAIDSLTVSGKVLDAIKNEPLENITVTLYDLLDDTAVIKTKPIYVAKTDKSGVFKLQNIRYDTFALYVFKDENQSLTFNQESELFGFTDSLIILDGIHNYDSLKIKISKPHLTYRIFESDTKLYGLIRQKWNVAPYDEVVPSVIGPTSINFFSKVQGDSVKTYYTTLLDTFDVSFSFDTIGVKVPSDRLAPEGLTFSLNGGSNFLLPKDSINIVMTTPIKYIDTSKISLKDTSLNNLPFKVELKKGFNISLYILTSLSDQAYSLNIDSAAFIDIYGQASASNRYKFNGIKASKTSEIKATIEGLDSTKYYTVRLKEGDNTLRIVTADKVSKTTLNVNYLKPSNYILEIIEDTNRNGQWDPVDFINKKQAEEIRTFAIDKLKENWTLETTFKYQ